MLCALLQVLEDTQARALAAASIRLSTASSMGNDLQQAVRAMLSCINEGLSHSTDAPGSAAHTAKGSASGGDAARDTKNDGQTDDAAAAAVKARRASMSAQPPADADAVLDLPARDACSVDGGSNLLVNLLPAAHTTAVRDLASSSSPSHVAAEKLVIIEDVPAGPSMSLATPKKAVKGTPKGASQHKPTPRAMASKRRSVLGNISNLLGVGSSSQA